MKTFHESCSQIEGQDFIPQIKGENLQNGMEWLSHPFNNFSAIACSMYSAISIVSTPIQYLYNSGRVLHDEHCGVVLIWKINTSICTRKKNSLM